MTMNFVQYHKTSFDNPLPLNYQVHTKKLGDVKVGDIVWLLSGKEASGPKLFEFIFWFEVDKIESRIGKDFIITGTKGHRFEPPWAVYRKQEPWFDGFMKRVLGNGTFGFVAIPAEYVSTFDSHMTVVDDDAKVGDLGTDGLDVESYDSGPDDIFQMRAVLTRRGQREFRERLLKAYHGRCAVTGSRVVGLLEAAHLTPHSEGGKYELSNGILLRADIHTLFDLNLLGIDNKLRVHLAKKLELQHSEYTLYHKRQIEILPDSIRDHPRTTALERRFNLFSKSQEW